MKKQIKQAHQKGTTWKGGAYVMYGVTAFVILHIARHIFSF